MSGSRVGPAAAMAAACPAAPLARRTVTGTGLAAAATAPSAARVPDQPDRVSPSLPTAVDGEACYLVSLARQGPGLESLAAPALPSCQLGQDRAGLLAELEAAVAVGQARVRLQPGLGNLKPGLIWSTGPVPESSHGPSPRPACQPAAGSRSLRLPVLVSRGPGPTKSRH